MIDPADHSPAPTATGVFTLPPIGSLFDAADYPKENNVPLAFPHPPPAPQHRTSNSSITSSSTSLSSDDHSSYLPPLSVGGSSSAFSSGRSTRINSLNSLTSEGHAYALAPSPGSEGVYRRLSVREEEAEEAAAGGIGGLGQFGSRKESEDSVGGGWTRRPSDIDPLVLGNSFKNSHVRNGSNTSASSSTNGGMFAYGSSDLPTLPSLRSLSLSAPAPPLPSSSAGPRPSSSGSSSAFFPSVSPFSTLHPPSNANAGFTGPPPSTVPSSRYLPSSADPSSPTRPNSAPWSEGVYRAETMGWGSHVVNEMVDDANAGLLGSTEGASDPSSQRAIRMGSEGEEPPHHQRRISSGLGWSSRPGGSAKSRGSFGEGTAQIPYHPYASTQRPVATSQHPSFSSSNSRPPTGSSSRAERFGQTFNVPSHSSTTLNRIRRSSLPVSQSLNQFPPLPYLASRSNSIPDPNQSAHGHNQFAYPYTYLTQPPHPTEAHLPAPPPPPSFASRVIFPTPTDESPFGCHQPWHAPQPGSYFDAHFVDISSTASVDSRPSSRPSSSHSRSSAGGSRTGVIVDTAPSSPGPQRAMLTKSSSATRLAGVSSRKSNAKPITIPTPSSTASGSTGSSTSAVKGGSSYVCEFCSKKFNRPSSLRIHTYSHTGEKPFACDHPSCGRKFSVQSNLKRHSRIHNNSTESYQFQTASRSASTRVHSSSRITKSGQDSETNDEENSRTSSGSASSSSGGGSGDRTVVEEGSDEEEDEDEEDEPDEREAGADMDEDDD